jgi:hypothetical protein
MRAVLTTAASNILAAPARFEDRQVVKRGRRNFARNVLDRKARLAKIVGIELRAELVK